MAYIGAIIRGEKDLLKYCEKRWGGHPKFNGCFAHIDNCKIEMIYELSPTDDCYTDYYIMLMQHPGGNIYNESDYRRTVHESIRNGSVALLKVR